MHDELVIHGELIMQGGLIQSNPSIMMGKPVITGTRITVELILEKLAHGETVEQILGAHPRLTAEGIHAALAFAVRVVRGWSAPLLRYQDELPAPSPTAASL